MSLKGGHRVLSTDDNTTFIVVPDLRAIVAIESPDVKVVKLNKPLTDEQERARIEHDYAEADAGGIYTDQKVNMRILRETNKILPPKLRERR